MADDRGLLFVLLFFYAHNRNTFAEEAVGVGGTQGCERRGGRVSATELLSYWATESWC